MKSVEYCCIAQLRLTTRSISRHSAVRNGRRMGSPLKRIISSGSMTATKISDPHKLHGAHVAYGAYSAPLGTWRYQPSSSCPVFHDFSQSFRVKLHDSCPSYLDEILHCDHEMEKIRMLGWQKPWCFEMFLNNGWGCLVDGDASHVPWIDQQWRCHNKTHQKDTKTADDFKITVQSLVPPPHIFFLLFVAQKTDPTVFQPRGFNGCTARTMSQDLTMRPLGSCSLAASKWVVLNVKMKIEN